MGDRVSDIFDFLSGTHDLNWDYVIRSKHDRTINFHGKDIKLKQWIRGIKPRAEDTLELRSRNGKLGRKVTLKIACGSALLNPPKGKSGTSMHVNYVRAYSEDDRDL